MRKRLVLPVSIAVGLSSAVCVAQGGATSTSAGQIGVQTSGQAAGAPSATQTAPAATQTVTAPTVTSPGSPAPATYPDAAAPPAPAGVNSGLPAEPVPTPADPAQVPARSGYYGQQVPATTIQQPTPGRAPVVVPAQTTTAAPVAAMPPYIPYGIPDEDRRPSHDGSTYIPLDSWVYPAVLRLYSLGFADTMFLGMRPYTRQSLLHILENTADDVMESDNDEAKETYIKLMKEVQQEASDGVTPRGLVYGTKAVYDRALGISGTSLRDSYHLGQTINNDYGRPYEGGFNNIVGFHEIAEYGRFSLDVRGEYEHSPSADGYSQQLSAEISNIDQIDYSGYNLHQATIPSGPIAAANPFRLQEASLSFHVLGHEISGGKTDDWQGPALGGAFAYTNNAENIYSFRINRVEPLHIPYVFALLGPIRYEFMYGSLKGHTFPNNDWMHTEMVSFRPTKNVEFGFQRTVIFGGQGHEPVTLHTFLKGFFDISDTTMAEKYSRDDPGARYTAFNFSWRLPFLSHTVTLYTDSEAHDDVTPPSAPRRAAYRPGLEFSHVPGIPKLEFRVEAVSTDTSTLRSLGGTFNYYETVQRQAYTNKGFIFGDWIGREAKGGQAWLTYHLSGDEYVQLEYLNKKNPKDFINSTAAEVNGPYPQGGTTQNDFKLSVLKRFHHDDIELNAWFQYEKWNAPIYKPGAQTDTETAVQVTFFPGLKRRTSIFQ